MKVKRAYLPLLVFPLVVGMALFLWDREMNIPSERTSASRTSAFDLYVGGHFQAAFETLMSFELEKRSLNDSSIGAVERLLLDLYILPELNLSSLDVSEAFSKLLSRSDLPRQHRQRLTVYEKELRDNFSSMYTVDSFLNQIELLNEQRQLLRENKKSTLSEIEKFRIYYAHALKKWNETKKETPNLRWLFAAGYAGSFYYAQGRQHLEEYISTCYQLAQQGKSKGVCRTDEVLKAREVRKLISGLDEPL